MHTEQKAHDTLIHAVQRLAERGLNVELVVTGNCPLEQDLRELTEKLEVAVRIYFLGLHVRPLLYDLLVRLEVLSMPSS